MKALMVLNMASIFVVLFLVSRKTSNTTLDTLKSPSLPPHSSPAAFKSQAESTSTVVDAVNMSNAGDTRDINSQPKSNPIHIDDEAKAAILTNIHDAAISYDSSGIPLIEPFLRHEDKEIRMAAVEGMLTLGETTGAKILRNAASNLSDPREAAEYLDAADYLELEPVTMTQLNQELVAKAKEALHSQAMFKKLSPSIQKQLPPPVHQQQFKRTRPPLAMPENQ